MHMMKKIKHAYDEQQMVKHAYDEQKIKHAYDKTT